MARNHRMASKHRKPRIALLLSTAVLLPLATACGGDSAADSDQVTVTVGYQSKTINTVTAGTLLRELGYFERELKKLGKKDGRTYKVEWQDYATGAPITAQMTADKIDIGSMGDFPLLLNAARGKQLGRDTQLISTTGYNLKGALNTVVTKPGSKTRTLADLKGRKVSTSIGSAADGTLVRALQQDGIDPEKDLKKLNQQPAVGASALEAGSADALSQFVAWPGLLAFQGKAQALYDGAELDLPTFHGVAARTAFADERPEVIRAFLAAQRDATTYLHDKPLAASQKVAKETKLPPEVVHLYNGPNGIATFDLTLKSQLIAALKKDVPVLRSAGLVKEVDVDGFVKDSHVKKLFGDDYAKELRDTTNKAALPGDPAKASEVWRKGESGTKAFADPTALLRYVAKEGQDAVRAAYVPDTANGTRWFADRSVWVLHDGTPYPFVTDAAARDWAKAKSGARVVSYAQALKAAR